MPPTTATTEKKETAKQIERKTSEVKVAQKPSSQQAQQVIVEKIVTEKVYVTPEKVPCSSKAVNTDKREFQSFVVDMLLRLE